MCHTLFLLLLSLLSIITTRIDNSEINHKNERICGKLPVIGRRDCYNVNYYRAIISNSDIHHILKIEKDCQFEFYFILYIWLLLVVSLHCYLRTNITTRTIITIIIVTTIIATSVFKMFSNIFTGYAQLIIITIILSLSHDTSKFDDKTKTKSNE